MPRKVSLKDLYLCRDFADLQDRATKSKISDRLFLKCSRLIETVEHVFSEANLSEKELDEEKAFIFYYRCCELCSKLKTCTDYTTYKNLPAHAVAMENFQKAMERSEELEASLRRRYELRTAAEDAQDPVEETQENPEEETEEEGHSLSPRTLHSRSKSDGMSVLLLDFRDESQRSAVPNLPSHGFHLLHIPPQLLTPGCIGNSLEKNLPIVDRSAFLRRKDADLVVLMDKRGSESLLTPGQKMKILYDAIFLYDSKKPKNKPLILDGGFENWKLHYPMFLEKLKDIEDCPESQFVIPDISRLSSLSYPDLNFLTSQPTFVEEEAKEVEPIPMVIPPPEPVRPPSPEAPKVPFIPDRGLKPIPKRAPPSETDVSLSYTQPTEEMAAENEEPSNGVPIPEVDRSTKLTPKFEDGVPSEDSSRLDSAMTTHIQNRERMESLKKKLKEARLPSGSSLESQSSRSEPVIRRMEEATNQQPRRPMVDRSNKPAHPINIQELQEFDWKLLQFAGSELKRLAIEGRTTPGLTGLYNLGNTCYMNSIVQALAHTKDLAEYFTKRTYISHIRRDNRMSRTGGQLPSIFASVMMMLRSGLYVEMNLSIFKKFVAQATGRFGDFSQQDAQEFLLLFVDALHEDLNQGQKRPTSEQNNENLPLITASQYHWRDLQSTSRSFINELFRGQEILKMRCRACGFESVTFGAFSQIALELPVFEIGLEKSLENHLEEESMEGDWQCPKCRKRRATRKLDFWRLPPVLVIYLKRFKETMRGHSKLETAVHFPMELNLSPFCHPASAHPPDSLYQLYAVVNHFGGLDSGHYTALCRGKGGRWYNFNDRIVEEVSGSWVTDKRAAYVLFYTCRKW